MLIRNLTILNSKQFIKNLRLRGSLFTSLPLSQNCKFSLDKSAFFMIVCVFNIEETQSKEKYNSSKEGC